MKTWRVMLLQSYGSRHFVHVSRVPTEFFSIQIFDLLFLVDLGVMV